MQLFKIHGRLQMIHARFSKYMIKQQQVCYKSGNREQFFAKRKIASDFKGWPKCEQLRA